MLQRHFVPFHLFQTSFSPPFFECCLFNLVFAFHFAPVLPLSNDVFTSILDIYHKCSCLLIKMSLEGKLIHIWRFVSVVWIIPSRTNTLWISCLGTASNMIIPFLGVGLGSCLLYCLGKNTSMFLHAFLYKLFPAMRSKQEKLLW